MKLVTRAATFNIYAQPVIKETRFETQRGIVATRVYLLLLAVSSAVFLAAFVLQQELITVRHHQPSLSEYRSLLDEEGLSCTCRHSVAYREVVRMQPIPDPMCVDVPLRSRCHSDVCEQTQIGVLWSILDVFRGLCASGEALAVQSSVDIGSQFVGAGVLVNERRFRDSVASNLAQAKNHTKYALQVPISLIQSMRKAERPFTYFMSQELNWNMMFADVPEYSGYTHKVTSRVVDGVRMYNASMPVLSQGFWSAEMERSGTVKVGDRVLKCTCAMTYDCSFEYPIAGFTIPIYCTVFQSALNAPLKLMASKAYYEDMGFKDPKNLANFLRWKVNETLLDTAEDGFDVGFMSRWELDYNYEDYFALCEPDTCSYTRKGSRPITDGIGIIFGAISGISFLLKPSVFWVVKKLMTDPFAGGEGSMLLADQ